MNKQNQAQPIHHTSLLTLALLGAIIGFALIGLFLMGVHNPKPEWPKFWMLKPLIVVPIAGGIGGTFFYLMSYLRSHNGWNKIVVYVISLIGFIFCLWLGTVLGLNGTLWD